MNEESVTQQRPSRTELIALGTATVFSYVGAVVLAARFGYLAGNYATLNPPFQVLWWIGGVCWFLALVLAARFGYRLARRLAWDGVIVTVLAVIPWTVTTALAILIVVMIVISFR